jgi:mannan endo-1,4-beta-mannosidase
MLEPLKSTIVLILSCACLLPGTGMAQTTYRWHNWKGTHYSDVCPSGITCMSSGTAPRRMRGRYATSSTSDTTSTGTSLPTTSSATTASTNTTTQATSSTTTSTSTTASTTSGSTTVATSTSNTPSTSSGGSSTSASGTPGVGDGGTSTSTSGTSSNSTVATSTPTPTTSTSGTSGTSGAVTPSGQRPYYNAGVGFYVGTDKKLYDANDVEFKMRGFNSVHPAPAGSHPGMLSAGASAIRYNANPTDPATTNALAKSYIDLSVIPIPAVWGHSVTGSTTTSTLNAAVADWVNNAAAYKPYEQWMIINIANEWGPADSNGPYGGPDKNGAAWEAAYESAITAMRNAGYLNTLMIDCGEYGKNWHDIIDQGQKLLDFDPQHNLIFSVHLYDYAAQSPSQLASMFSALNATGLPYVVGEFGPDGLNGSKSTPLQIMTAAENAGVGWLAWAWDDNNLGSPACQANDTWFALVYNFCSGGYTGSSAQLTNYGKVVVLDPTYGLQNGGYANARYPKATVFP